MMKLSNKQERMLKNAYNNSGGNWGYAPCGPGFKSTMKSLVRMGLAFATGQEYDIRGIVLTQAGRQQAERLLALV